MALSESEHLADVFATIARELEAAAGPGETQRVVTRRAIEMVPGCAYAGISLIRERGAISTVAATDDVVHRIDAIQYETGEGPCLGAMIDQVIHTVNDLRYEQRWPWFVRRAVAETGIASMLSFRLFTSESVRGTLNLYSTEANAFDGHSRAVGTILAAHAAIALLAARQNAEVDDIEAAVRNGRNLGIAIGLLMARRGCTRDHALELLVNAAQRLNRPLQDIATVVIDSGGRSSTILETR